MSKEEGPKKEDEVLGDIPGAPDAPPGPPDAPPLALDEGPAAAPAPRVVETAEQKRIRRAQEAQEREIKEAVDQAEREKAKQIRPEDPAFFNKELSGPAMTEYVAYQNEKIGDARKEGENRLSRGEMLASVEQESNQLEAAFPAIFETRSELWFLHTESPKSEKEIAGATARLAAAEKAVIDASRANEPKGLAANRQEYDKLVSGIKEFNSLIQKLKTDIDATKKERKEREENYLKEFAQAKRTESRATIKAQKLREALKTPGADTADINKQIADEEATIARVQPLVALSGGEGSLPNSRIEQDHKNEALDEYVKKQQRQVAMMEQHAKFLLANRDTLYVPKKIGAGVVAEVQEQEVATEHPGSHFANDEEKRAAIRALGIQYFKNLRNFFATGENEEDMPDEKMEAELDLVKEDLLDRVVLMTNFARNKPQKAATMGRKGQLSVDQMLEVAAGVRTLHSDKIKAKHHITDPEGGSENLPENAAKKAQLENLKKIWSEQQEKIKAKRKEEAARKAPGKLAGGATAAALDAFFGGKFGGGPRPAGAAGDAPDSPLGAGKPPVLAGAPGAGRFGGGAAGGAVGAERRLTEWESEVMGKLMEVMTSIGAAKPNVHEIMNTLGVLSTQVVDKSKDVHPQLVRTLAEVQKAVLEKIPAVQRAQYNEDMEALRKAVAAAEMARTGRSAPTAAPAYARDPVQVIKAALKEGKDAKAAIVAGAQAYWENGNTAPITDMTIKSWFKEGFKENKKAQQKAGEAGFVQACVAEANKKPVKKLGL